MKRNSLARSLFLPLLATAALAACSDSADPTPAPVVPKFSLLNVSNPIGITPDGKTAVFEDLMGTLDGDLYTYDVATGTLTLTTQVGSSLTSFAPGVSADGRVSAVYSDPATAGIWNGTAWATIPSSFPAGCDNSINGAWGISQDGHVAVGFDWDGCNTKGMRWTEVAGTWTGVPLEVFGSGSNRPTHVSGNGLIAAGSVATEAPFALDRKPTFWNASGTAAFVPQGEFTDDSPGEVLALNYDGTMMAGVWNNQGWYWTAATGTVNLGQLDGFAEFPKTMGLAIAANDKMIFGTSLDQAFVWTKSTGMRRLQDIVTAAGLVIPEGLTLVTATAASADGTVVIGQAVNDRYQYSSFVLTLPIAKYRP